MGDSNGRGNCHNVFKLPNPTIEAVADRLSTYGYSNRHWIPQSHFCGGTVNTHWKSFTDHVDVHKLSAGIPKIFGGRVPEAVMRSLKKQLTANHTSSHITHAEQRIRTLTPNVRRKLVDFYWADYRLFLIHGASVSPLP